MIILLEYPGGGFSAMLCDEGDIAISTDQTQSGDDPAATEFHPNISRLPPLMARPDYSSSAL